MTGQEKQNRLIRELRQEIIAATMQIGDSDDLMHIYSYVLALLFTAKQKDPFPTRRPKQRERAYQQPHRAVIWFYSTRAARRRQGTIMNISDFLVQTSVTVKTRFSDGTVRALPVYKIKPREDGRPSINTVEGWNLHVMENIERRLVEKLGRQPTQDEIDEQLKEDCACVAKLEREHEQKSVLVVKA